MNFIRSDLITHKFMYVMYTYHLISKIIVEKRNLQYTYFFSHNSKIRSGILILLWTILTPNTRRTDTITCLSHRLI